MDDLIIRQATIDVINSLPKWPDAVSATCLDYADVISALSDTEKLPSVEPGRKTGHWVEHYGDSKCSECGYVLKIDDTNYCPNCGAYMRGEQE